MAEPPTEEIPAGVWQPAALGLLARHAGRRVRFTVDVPSRERGQTFAGRLGEVHPSDRSPVHQDVTITEDDGSARTFTLPLGHPIEVLIEPPIEPPPVGEDRADALIAEAVRRYETDPRFHARAYLAAHLAQRTEYSDLDGAVLVGAVLALIVAEHPELIP